MRDTFSKVLGVGGGQSSDTADCVVSELESHPGEKIYLGSCLPFVQKPSINTD
jgi:hypothetical protein